MADLSDKAAADEVINSARNNGSDDNKELVEKIADSMMEYLPSNMGVFNPDDPTSYKWAKAIANNCAQAALSIIQPELDKRDAIIEAAKDVLCAANQDSNAVMQMELRKLEAALKTTTGHDL